VATTIDDLQVEREYVTGLIDLAREVQASGQESKFDRLRSIIEDKRLRNEKLLVFTEHRDTLVASAGRIEAGGIMVHGWGGHGRQRVGKKIRGSRRIVWGWSRA
jgi:ERCC4-related helicase